MTQEEFGLGEPYFTKDAISAIRAVVTSELLGKVPEGDEEVEKWMKENPEEAKRFDEMIELVLAEFRKGPRPEFEKNLGERLIS